MPSCAIFKKMLTTILTFANNQKNNCEQATGSGDRVTCVHVDFISLCSVTDFFDKVCCNVKTIFFYFLSATDSTIST